MTIDLLLKPDVLAQIDAPQPDWSVIKQAVLTAYEQDTGQHLHLAQASPDERAAFVDWVMNRFVNDPQWARLMARQTTVSVPGLAPCLSQHIDRLSQFHCPLCTGPSSYPIKRIVLRISPISYQAADKKPGLLAAFKKAIRHQLNHYQGCYPKSAKLCVAMLFGLGCQTRDKDLDNMAKGLLDALQNLLYENDMKIVHLNLMKIPLTEAEDFVLLNLRQSHLHQQDHVIFPTLHHGWGGMTFLDLKDFMDTTHAAVGERRPS